MRKIKVLLSWVLTICLMVSLCAGINTASAATTLGALGIVLDDNTVTAGTAVGNTFTVKIPDGRPRVPQVSCDGATVYQAQLPDTATEGEATVIKNGTTYTIKFVKDASLGFVLQYDDYYTWNTGLSGTTYSSSNTGIATVDSNGEIHVVKVSDTPVTITATTGSATKTLTISKTIRAVLGIWMVTGQSNSAYNYNDAATSIVPAKGTAYYSGKYAAAATNTIEPMTNNNGKANVGGVEPGIAKAWYEKTGEKSLIMNAGISGTGIGYFVPGCGTAEGTYTWALINGVYERAYAEWSKTSFQNNFEVRMRSYFFLQGCAEVGSHWSKHYDGFAVTKNTNAFTTLGKNYTPGSHTFRTYMTDVLGFDYCMDMMVAWRPVGITASTRTAQFKLAEDFDDYFVASRIGQTFSQAEGTYRYDELHYNQTGKNYYGLHTGANAARIYSGKAVIEAATGATAFFNQIGFKDGDTLYVKAGDFYNYCTRADSWTSDDTFGYKFVGDDIVEYDGENDFVVKSTAAPGASCDMEIYSCADNTSPIATIKIKVIGETSEDFNSIYSEEYSWTFDNGVPTTVAGDIGLTPASESNSGFAGKSALELSRDLMLDSDGYWSIEWKSASVGNGSMLLSSSDAYAKSTNPSGQPNFIFVYHTNDTGWRMFRDTAYTDNFWRGYTGSPITKEQTYKLECRNNVYTFSIDGEVMDSRKIVEGHGSYGAGSSYSGAGYFDNVFNVHYLLGGINQNGIGSTKYGYDGKVSYVTIKIGEEKPAISNINGFPYEAASGKGTAADPYVINAKVAAGTKINDASFTINAPAGTVTFSAEGFGGAALETLTCDAGTKSVYVMILGALPHMSTFYKVNLTVSDTPEKLPDDIYPDASTVMVDAAAGSLATGAAKKYTVEGTEYSFVKGYNLYANVNDAHRAVAEGGTILLAAGTYSEAVTFTKDITVKGAQAGVDPNAKTQDEKVWTAVRSDLTKESVITGLWTVADGCDSFTLDGVAFNKTGRLFNGKSQAGSTIDFVIKNILIDAVSTDQALRFGDTSTSNDLAVSGSLLMENVRAVNLTKNNLFVIALGDVTIQNSYFDDGSRVAKFLLPDVADGATDHTASIVFEGNLLDGATKNAALDLAFSDSDSKYAANYSDVTISVQGNVFLNTVADTVTDVEGVICLSADQRNFTFSMENNLIYEGDASASTADKAFLTVGGDAAFALEDTDHGDFYVINKNRFVSVSADVPMIVSSDSSSRKNHNNINVGGNYAEVAGTAIRPNTNTTATAYTNNVPISFLNYYYTKADFSEGTCDHTETETTGVPATCQTAGYEILTCTACGEVLQRVDLPISDHIASDWIIETEASCTEDGVRVKTCIFSCGLRMEEDISPAYGHDEGYWTNLKDPSCTEEGERARLCGRCDCTLESKPIARKAHAFEVAYVEEATCTAAGYTEYACVVCGEPKTEVIAQKLHTPGKWTVVAEPTCDSRGEEQITCTECGTVMETRYSEPAHVGEWIDILPSENGSIGIKAYVCTVCGLVIDSQIELVVIESVAVKKFEDVGLNDWFVKNGAIDTVVWFGLFAGTSENTFSPNMPMTRAMFVTVLGRLEGVAVDHDVTTRFTDVKKGTWYTGYVAWAVENGIVHGMDYYTFAPNAPITREQICKMVIAFCDQSQITLDEVAAEKTFADEKAISGWAKPYVKACQKAGIITGREDNRFDPKGKATRAEVATIMTKLLTNMGVLDDLMSLI